MSKLKVKFVKVRTLLTINIWCRRLLMVSMLGMTATAHAETVKTLQWDDLIPAEVLAELKKGQPAVINHTGDPADLEMSPAMSAVRKELDGQRVKLPGFMVPLDGDENKVTEFLLVPYFGACIHTPPPPANQIVYVDYPKGVNPQMLYDPVWIEGPIKAGEVESELAVSGYSMKAIDVTAYTEQP